MSECRGILQYRCGDEGEAEAPTGSEGNFDLEHNVSQSYTIDFSFYLFTNSITRRFSLKGALPYTRTNYWVNEVSCEGLGTPPCYSWCYETDSSASGSVSDTITRHDEQILYVDMKASTILVKRTMEVLSMSGFADSDPTQFRGKWGNTDHVKFKITNGVINGTEQFILVSNGSETVLNEVVYTREPQWEMEAIGLPTTDGVVWQDDCNFEPVQQIIVWPLPASKSTPLDKEILCLGFYDYGNPDPLTENPLIRKDGGKDFFYPSWWRGMGEDKALERLVEDRVAITWDKLEPSPPRHYALPEVPHQVVPAGNAVVEPLFGSMYSFSFQDRNGVAHAVSALQGKPPSHYITSIPGIDGYGEDWLYHPVSVI